MVSFVDMFNEASDSIRDKYQQQLGVMSFAEYLGEIAPNPQGHLRDAARFALDAIEYYGTSIIKRPWGEETRYKIFDQEFADSSNRLVGQEAAQSAVRSALASQVRDGEINRLIVIHGPNGSAKSTLVNNLFTGLENYSRLPEGLSYRFRWIFPSRKTSHGTVGFGARLKKDKLESFAHLDDEQIDASLECEVRDHPLLLLPKKQRIELMEKALEQAGITDYQIPHHLLEGSLCHRCRQVADALMRTHQGDLRKVLAHVQVESWALSRRYRRGLVQVGPQMSVDASERQITADRRLSALPIELQNMAMFETYGPLVNGAGGIVEFEDMLKRNLESYKYLLGTIETGEAMLGQAILKVNTVLMATTNDIMLEAFREHHEYMSFRDRLTLVPVPYLRQYDSESDIYELQVAPNIGRHVAPHAIDAGSYWAVMTRLHKPQADRYLDELKPLISQMEVGKKAELYNNASTSKTLSTEQAALLRDAVNGIRNEGATSWT